MLGVAFTFWSVFWCCTCLTICPVSEADWGIVLCGLSLFTIPPSRQAVPPPLTQGRLLVKLVFQAQIIRDRRNELRICGLYSRLPPGGSCREATEGECVTIKLSLTQSHAGSFRHASRATADCQASATPKNASNGERHPKHFLGLRLIDKTIFCKDSLSKEWKS